MLSGYLAFDEADPVVGSHGDDAHHGELIDGRREYDGIAEDVRQLWHQQVDALILERRESYIKSVSIPAEDARKKYVLTLVDGEDGFQRVKEKGHTDHDRPDRHRGAGHPEHEQGDEYLLRW